MRKSLVFLSTMTLLALPVLAHAQTTSNTNHSTMGSGTAANGSPVGGMQSNASTHPTGPLVHRAPHHRRHVMGEHHPATSPAATNSGNSASGTTNANSSPTQKAK